MKWLMTIAVGGAVASGQGGAPVRQTLQFDWPIGIVARVETDYVREAVFEQTRQEISHLRMTHEMRVVGRDDGTRAVEYTKQSHVESADDIMQAVNALLPLWVPTSVVSEQGKFLRILGAETLRELVAEMVEPQLPRAEQIPQFREFLKSMTTEEALSSLAAAEWDKLVGRWIGMSLEKKTTEDTGAIGPAPGVTVPTKVTVSMIERRPCPGGRAPRECATFELRSRIDREGMAAAMKEMLKGATGLPASIPEYLDYETVLRVTLETETMLPHESTMTQSSHGQVTLNGRTLPTSDSERRHSQFIYSPEQ